MQRRPCQVRDRRLQSVQAIIQRQQRVTAKGDDDSLLLDRQNGRPRLLRTGLAVIEGSALPPLRNRLRVDPVALGESSQALLTILYCSTDCRCRAGAPVEYLAHSASFHCRPNNAPSNPGTKHLAADCAPISFLAGLFVGATLIQLFFHAFHVPVAPEQEAPEPISPLKIMSYAIQAQPARAWKE